MSGVFSEQIFFADGVLSLVTAFFIGVMFLYMAVEDWKTTYVSGWVCWVCWILIYCVYYLCNRSVISAVIILAGQILFLLRERVPFFGDADLLPVCAFFAYYGRSGSLYFPTSLRLMYPLLSLLLVMYPLARRYYAAQGKTYKLFTGMAVPMMPAFAVAWMLGLLEELLVSLLL